MYSLRTPAAPLAPFIEHYWFVDHTPGRPLDLRVEVFVDARADLVFNFGVGYRREVIGGRTTLHRRANLDAQRLVPIRIHQKGLVRIVGVRFRLGGLGAFTRKPLAAWTGRTPAPRALLGPGATQLEAALAEATTGGRDAQVDLLDGFFTAALDTGGAFPTFARALAALVTSDGQLRVADTARAATASSRQVDRLFARYLGLPPKTLARVLRFQHALRALMRDPGVPLADVGAAAGYFDQAHFIKEFRKLSGGVPRGYRGYFPAAGPADFAPNVVVFLQDGPRRRR